jgi:putative Ca2+/H+ antiporter (TMEM165/GDT1 family)
MVDTTFAVFVAIAASLFVVELADKDALLILAFATRIRPRRVFLAGAAAFLFTTTVIVSFGAVLVTFVPIAWVRLGGGVVMVGYGASEARHLFRKAPAEEAESRSPGGGAGWKGFLAMAGALALLDLAGDATEVLIILFLAQYGLPLLVFSASCVGLITATAVETAVGNTLARILTPRRLLYFSAGVFLIVGSYVIVSGL